MQKDIQIFMGVQIGGIKYVVDKRIPWDKFEQMRYPKEFIDFAIDANVEELKKEVEKNSYLN